MNALINALETLNTIPVTTEDEKEIDSIITGTSGRQYVAMDTTPPVINVTPPSVFSERQDEPSLAEMFSTLVDMVGRIGDKVGEIERHYHQAQSAKQEPQDLLATVETVLQQGDWLFDKVIDTLEKKYSISAIVETAVDNDIKSEIENWFDRSFDLGDYVDINEVVRSEVADVIEDHVREILADKLQDAEIKIQF